MKEEELVCESKPNVNEEMKAEPGVEKTNEDLVKDEKIEGVSIMFFFFSFFLQFKYCFCQQFMQFSVHCFPRMLFLFNTSIA